MPEIKYYKVSCFINGVEDNIRATKSTKLIEVEEKLGAWLTQVSERVYNIVRLQVIEDREKFIRPSKEQFLNNPEEILTLVNFRRNLDEFIYASKASNKEGLYMHSKQLNKYIRNYYSEPYN